jgi:uncharacterized membrane protein YkvI
MVSTPASTWFQRTLLPGLAFKAVVIGGGYATGRELAEFFLPHGPWGGLLAILFATALFSLISVVSFLFARRFRTYDYQSFFRRLLGPGWLMFEAAYLLFLVLILAVYGAAAGEIGQALLGATEIAGTLLLMALIAGFVMYGNHSVERLFRDVSWLLYGVYALFVILALTRFGDRIVANMGAPPQDEGWAIGGLTYAGYNVIAAAVILPVLRHLQSDRDAIVSGLIAGPLTMLPALLFFTCMIAFYPEIADATLPSDFLLQRMELPLFHILFQIMIFSALLESASGGVHAINERIDHAWKLRTGRSLSHRARLVIALALLFGCMLLAGRFGLVALIANGYRALAYVLLIVFVLPLMTFGVWRLVNHRPPREEPA